MDLVVAKVNREIMKKSLDGSLELLKSVKAFVNGLAFFDSETKLTGFGTRDDSLPRSVHKDQNEINDFPQEVAILNASILEFEDKETTFSKGSCQLEKCDQVQQTEMVQEQHQMKSQNEAPRNSQVEENVNVSIQKHLDHNKASNLKYTLQNENIKVEKDEEIGKQGKETSAERPHTQDPKANNQSYDDVVNDDEDQESLTRKEGEIQQDLKLKNFFDTVSEIQPNNSKIDAISAKTCTLPDSLSRIQYILQDEKSLKVLNDTLEKQTGVFPSLSYAFGAMGLDLSKISFCLSSEKEFKQGQAIFKQILKNHPHRSQMKPELKIKKESGRSVTMNKVTNKDRKKGASKRTSKRRSGIRSHAAASATKNKTYGEAKISPLDIESAIPSVECPTETITSSPQTDPVQDKEVSHYKEIPNDKKIPQPEDVKDAARIEGNDDNHRDKGRPQKDLEVAEINKIASDLVPVETLEKTKGDNEEDKEKASKLKEGEEKDKDKDKDPRSSVKEKVRSPRKGKNKRNNLRGLSPSKQQRIGQENNSKRGKRNTDDAENVEISADDNKRRRRSSNQGAVSDANSSEKLFTSEKKDKNQEPLIKKGNRKMKEKSNPGKGINSESERSGLRPRTNVQQFMSAPRVNAEIAKDLWTSGYSRQATEVWKAIQHMKISAPFRKPVTENEAPGYFDAIKNPMDLSTIRKNLINNVYRSPFEFYRDLTIMCRNAMVYNEKGSDIDVLARDLRETVKCKMEPILEKWKKDINIKSAEASLATHNVVPSPMPPEFKEGKEHSAVIEAESHQDEGQNVNDNESDNNAIKTNVSVRYPSRRGSLRGLEDNKHGKKQESSKTMRNTQPAAKRKRPSSIGPSPIKGSLKEDSQNTVDEKEGSQTTEQTTLDHQSADAKIESVGIAGRKRKSKGRGTFPKANKKQSERVMKTRRSIQ